MITDISGSRHLALVFFDVLSLDSTSLLTTPYSQRRTILESLILISPGESMISERVPILMSSSDKTEQPQILLEKVFASIITNHQEGLIIKADEGYYHDFRMPWVKLKRDYIPGYGDALDLVVVGAGWDKVRARTLRGLSSTSHPPLILNNFNISSSLHTHGTLCWCTFQFRWTWEKGHCLARFFRW